MLKWSTAEWMLLTASRTLIHENQVVCVKTLTVKNMMKNLKLAKHIADANWEEFVRQLKYKSEWADRTLVEIDRFFPSSKRCHACGFVNESLPLSIREWDCLECETHHDRDINAAKNIKTAGLAGLACGATGTGARSAAWLVLPRDGVTKQESSTIISLLIWWREQSKRIRA